MEYPRLTKLVTKTRSREITRIGASGSADSRVYHFALGSSQVLTHTDWTRASIAELRVSRLLRTHTGKPITTCEECGSDARFGPLVPRE